MIYVPLTITQRKSEDSVGLDDFLIILINLIIYSMLLRSSQTAVSKCMATIFRCSLYDTVVKVKRKERNRKMMCF